MLKKRFSFKFSQKNIDFWGFVTRLKKTCKKMTSYLHHEKIISFFLREVLLKEGNLFRLLFVYRYAKTIS
ncbi:hypothetical protein CHCC20335_2814 [Bacillus paralicheniformis]|nr:hypothetical protein CHCC20335_2814 [Bacillus paralicheniformis]